ncbi:DUF2142 domain-containing protein [Bacillus sp. DJP31]|uniref:DUF2142 domain-containing protein n=1 Tax=Bacillus sp. DJP31 TaxID=3409789 RepID=UPI003BB529DE
MDRLRNLLHTELKNSWLPLVIVTVVFLLFSLYIYENRGIFIAPREVENTVLSLNRSEDTLGEIVGNMKISQTFISTQKEFSRIQIPFKTYNRQNTGIISVELHDMEKNNLIFKQDIHLSDLLEGIDLNLDFRQVENAMEKEYQINIVSQDLVSGNSVTVWKSSTDYYKFGGLTIDGFTEPGDLHFKVIDVEAKKIKPILSKVVFVSLGLTILFIFVLTSIAIRRYKDQIHKVFLVTSIPVGLILTLIVPPFDHLDELEHYYRSFEVSEGKFTNQVTEQGLGNYLPLSLMNTVQEVRFIHQEGYRYTDVKDALHNKINPDDRIFIRNYASSYAPIIYIPQALGMIVGRVIFDSPIMMMFLGRIINFLTYVAIAYIAIMIVPVKKKLFYLVALMPMAIIQATSLSADAITNSSALLFVSYILYLAYGEIDSIKSKHIAICILIGLFVGLSKIVYLPIILLFLIIPLVKFEDKKDFMKKAIIILIGCTLPFLVWNVLNISNLSVPDLRVNPGVSPKNQVLFILTHPFHYIKYFIDTLLLQGPSQILSMVGKVATNYFYPAPSIVIYTFIFMLFFFGITNDESELSIKYRLKDRLIFLFTFFSVTFLIFTALYVGFTTVGGPIILGVQGRYFIPIAVLFFFSLSTRKIVIYDKNINFLINTMIHCGMFALLLQYIFEINK